MAESTYKKRVIQESSDEEGDIPLAKKPREVSPDTTPAPPTPIKTVPPPKVDVFTTGDSEDEDIKPDIANGNGNGNYQESSDDEKPLAQIVAKPARKRTTQESSDEKPLAKTRKKAPPKKSKKKASSDSEEETSKPKRKGKVAAAKPAAAKATTKAAKGSKVKQEEEEDVKLKINGSSKKKPKSEEGDGEGEGEEEEEEMHKWWEGDLNDEKKWTTLEHNGLMFPPEYEPHGVKMNYDGRPVTLPPEAEEVASFFAALLETDHAAKPVFCQNFFKSFLEILKEHPPTDGTEIEEYEKCDFLPIFAHLEAEKAVKKAMTSAEKKALKAQRDALEAPYKTCLLDGRKETVGNFRVEPPGLFRGRGEHPKTGMLKTRVLPEQITINIGREAKVPPAPPGHKWGKVVHEDKVTWLATWKENVNGNVKYVFLSANSSLKGMSDLKKFEKARNLKKYVDKIRADYTKDLQSREMQTRQRATAIYFIDRLALRNGNEKGEDEADTVGCCSLRFEHITLEPPNWVHFDFLGKDSIRYVNKVACDELVFKNIKIFKKPPKAVGDLLFDRLNTSIVNKYLNSYMEGLTAKVFRTYNASYTFVQQLKNTPVDGSIADKLLAYNRANRMVAVLCNHQRAVSKGHSAAMEKLEDKVRALKYQRRKLRYALLATDKKLYKEYTEDESDLDDDWIEEHEKNLVVLEREKIKKKFERENLKLAENNEKQLDEDELEERLTVADELEKTLKAEREQGWKENRLSEEKMVVNIGKLDEKIQVAKNNIVDRDEGKEIALGTSKINYIDPRISVAWCKKYDVPINKVLSKTLLTKFTWAQAVDADFEW